MKYILIAFAALVALGATSKASAAPQCEVNRPVMFANLDWDSNRFHTAVARYILEVGYGCKTDSLPGSTIPLLQGMAQGNIDVTMEIWKANIQDAWNKFESTGKVVQLGVNFPDSVQGWYVPKYLIEGDAKRGIKAQAPDLKSVSDLPKYKKLFTDPEEPSKGRFVNCILGWGCEKINTKKLKVYGLDKDFTNFRPGTAAALDANIASNFKRGKPFLSYYWGPTWMLGLYDLVLLQEPPYDPKVWKQLEDSPNPTAACAYPKIPVYVAANAKFAKQAPKLIAFLSKYSTTNALVSKALAFMQQTKGATAKDAAVNFLKVDPDVWKAWVPADVAQRVEASLK